MNRYIVVTGATQETADTVGFVGPFDSYAEADEWSGTQESKYGDRRAVVEMGTPVVTCRHCKQAIECPDKRQEWEWVAIGARSTICEKSGEYGFHQPYKVMAEEG